MKKRFLSFLIICFLFIGCLETTDGLTINEDGSGIYTMEIDISGMFTRMEMMKPEDSTAGSGVPANRKNFDSTVFFQSFVDTATDLTNEEKALLRNARAHIKINEKEKLFKIIMTYPFSRLTDVAQIMALNGSGKGSNAVQRIFKDKQVSQDSSEVEPNTPNFTDMYQMTYKDGLLERKIKPEKLRELEEQFKMAGENGMEEMISSIKINSVINLPRPAKLIKGEKVKLSGNKKTVTINCTMKDILANPKAVEYSIQY